MINTWQDFQDATGAWADSVFGNERSPRPILFHLKKEVNELIESPYNLEEYADGFILLIDSARTAGFSMEDILNACKEKLDKNILRKWGKPDENGVVEHIRGTLNGKDGEK